MKDNPHVDSLASDMRRIDNAQLLKDIDEVSHGTNAKVKNLMIWRNTYYAHRDPKKILKGKVLSEEYPITYEDVQTLLKKGVEIASRYSIIYVAASYSTQMVGADDFLKVLQTILRDVEAYEARLQEEIARLNATPAV